ncbi:MAG: DctP family TRAP transporter solute-binding subunit [candidate division NC10 bacterium]|nr:DctP family TRAP transporter solute-binding subunit [candidate division NC10 bacterium]
MKRFAVSLVGILGFAVGAILGPGLTADIRAAEFDLVEAHTSPPDHPYTLGMVRYADLVKERTKGRVAIQIHHSRQLGDERQVVEGLQLGTIHLTVTSTGPLGGFVPEMNVVDLPFLFRDGEHAYKVLDGEIGRSLLNKFDAVGIKGLAFWENGFRHITTSKKPVREPADMKGLKIRVMENKVHQAAFRQLGSDATPMAWGEVFTSLQQGLLDAQENPIPIIYTFKLNEVQKYVALTGHVYSPAPLLMSKKSWNRMPPDIQRIMFDTALEVARYQRGLIREQEQKQIGELKAKGMTVVENPDRAAFREAMKPVFEQFQGQFGKDLVQRIVNTK